MGMVIMIIMDIQETTIQDTVDTIDMVDTIEDITLPRKLSLLLSKMQTLNLKVDILELEEFTLKVVDKDLKDIELEDIEEASEEATEEATVDTVKDIDLVDITLLERLSLSKTLMSMLLRATASKRGPLDLLSPLLSLASLK